VEVDGLLGAGVGAGELVLLSPAFVLLSPALADPSPEVDGAFVSAFEDSAPVPFAASDPDSDEGAELLLA
jgi:hypothetical protein